MHQRHLSAGGALFDGAFSNFAPLNCVVDLEPVARGLARLLKPGAAAMLVLFGTFCPGEMVTEVLRGRPHLALRRLKRGEVPARLAKRDFHVVYHRRAALLRAFAPWFVLEKRLGIGVTVPPSAAEPWISNHRAASCSHGEQWIASFLVRWQSSGIMSFISSAEMPRNEILSILPC